MLETVELEMLRRASLSVRDRVVEALLRKGDLRVRRRRASIGASLIPPRPEIGHRPLAGRSVSAIIDARRDAFANARFWE